MVHQDDPSGRPRSRSQPKSPSPPRSPRQRKGDNGNSSPINQSIANPPRVLPTTTPVTLRHTSGWRDEASPTLREIYGFQAHPSTDQSVHLEDHHRGQATRSGQNEPSLTSSDDGTNNNNIAMGSPTAPASAAVATPTSSSSGTPGQVHYHPPTHRIRQMTLEPEGRATQAGPASGSYNELGSLSEDEQPHPAAFASLFRPSDNVNPIERPFRSSTGASGIMPPLTSPVKQSTPYGRLSRGEQPQQPGDGIDLTGATPTAISQFPNMSLPIRSRQLPPSGASSQSVQPPPSTVADRKEHAAHAARLQAPTAPTVPIAPAQQQNSGHSSGTAVGPRSSSSSHHNVPVTSQGSVLAPNSKWAYKGGVPGGLQASIQPVPRPWPVGRMGTSAANMAKNQAMASSSSSESDTKDGGCKKRGRDDESEISEEDSGAEEAKVDMTALKRIRVTTLLNTRMDREAAEGQYFWAGTRTAWLNLPRRLYPQLTPMSPAALQRIKQLEDELADHDDQITRARSHASTLKNFHKLVANNRINKRCKKADLNRAELRWLTERRFQIPLTPPPTVSIDGTRGQIIYGRYAAAVKGLLAETQHIARHSPSMNVLRRTMGELAAMRVLEFVVRVVTLRSQLLLDNPAMAWIQGRVRQLMRRPLAIAGEIVFLKGDVPWTTLDRMNTAFAATGAAGGNPRALMNQTPIAHNLTPRTGAGAEASRALASRIEAARDDATRAETPQTQTQTPVSSPMAALYSPQNVQLDGADGAKDDRADAAPAEAAHAAEDANNENGGTAMGENDAIMNVDKNGGDGDKGDVNDKGDNGGRDDDDDDPMGIYNY